MTENGIRTVAAYATDQFTEKKSVFIGHIAPAHDEAEARAFVDGICEQHRQARHNCYAWICGENDRWQRSADAGEPAGTAGRPILEAIKHAGLHNTVLVVTRYFGGILLGAGGLTRAYAHAAQLAVNAAQTVLCVPAHRYAVSFDYGRLGKIDALLRQLEIEPEQRLFSDQVSLLCALTDRQYHGLSEQLTELSGATLHLQDLGEDTLLLLPQ